MEEEDADTFTKNKAKAKRIILKTVDAIDELMRNLGQRAVEAIIKSIRGTLDDLWRVFGVREASTMFKDVPVGRKIRAGKD